MVALARLLRQVLAGRGEPVFVSGGRVVPAAALWALLRERRVQADGARHGEGPVEELVDRLAELCAAPPADREARLLARELLRLRAARPPAHEVELRAAPATPAALARALVGPRLVLLCDRPGSRGRL